MRPNWAPCHPASAGRYLGMNRGQLTRIRPVAPVIGFFIAVEALAQGLGPPPFLPGVGPGPGDGGPRCHQVRMAASPNGYDFEAQGDVLLGQASVPEGVLTQAGLAFYYVNGGNQHGMFRAKANGASWDRGEPVLLDGAFNSNAVDPDVVVLGNGRYRMFYFEGDFGGSPRPGGPNPVSYFYSALSDDGITFTVEGQVFEAEGGTDPTAVRLDDGTWLLAVARGQANEVIVARSADGAVFEVVNTLTGAGIPELSLTPGGVRLFFNGLNGIISAHSTDLGGTWDLEPGFRLSTRSLAADPSVIAMPDGSWRMFYKTVDGDCAPAGGGAGPGPPPPPVPPGRPRGP